MSRAEGKSKKKLVGVRMTPEEIQVLDEVADAERRNRTSLIRFALDKYIDQHRYLARVQAEQQQ